MTPPLDRTAVLADHSLRGRRFAAAHTEVVDRWLAELYAEVIGDRPGCALVATGGHGRGELTPASDLDLLLLHDGKLSAELAQQLWYPIWDTGMKLGHSVRTRAETLQLAASDLATATALLSVRCLAGSVEATEELGDAARAQWARGAKRSLVELADAVDARHATASEVAFALEPDLKEGRGGLRDVQAIEWALAALPGLDIVDPDRLAERYEVVLATRIELHRATGRPGDRLFLQDQDEVARLLDLDDADVLMSRVAGAARTIAWESDEAWFEIRRQLGASRFRRGDKRVDLGHGVELVDGRVELADGTRPGPDSVLRVATAAARRSARIGRATLEWLREAPELADPWPAEARALFVELLGCGHDAVSVIESLDLADLWCRVVPEWEPNRSRPQRNAYHRFTVDRHLLETTANAAALVDRVQRPDLLLLGALFHDIGKGYPGDHALVGRDLAGHVCRRMGLSDGDVVVVQTLVEHHLLLPDVATRRDLDDPVTVRSVAAHAGDVVTLELLHALTEADSIATGTAAWGPWKEGLVATLAERARHVLEGGDVDEVATAVPHTATQRDLVERCATDGRVAMAVDGDRLTVVAPDRHALFSRIAAVLALNGLDVTEASARSDGGIVVDEFRVQSAFGSEIAWTKVERDLGRALHGRLAIEPRLAERARSYRRTRVTARTLDPNVRVLNEASADSTVVEVVGPDSIGLLYRLTRALADLDLDLRSAKVATMGNDVVDAFYVRTEEGTKVDDEADLTEIRAALLHALLVQPV